MTRPLRVTLVCGRYQPHRDGVADYVRLLAEHLRTPGNDAELRDCAAPRPSAGPANQTACEPPGQPQSYRQLAGDQRCRGVEVTLVAAAGAADPLPDGVIRVTSRWDLPGTASAARRIRAQRPDVVHIQFAPSAYGYSPAIGLLPVLLGRGGPAVVTTLHEYGWWRWPGRVPGAVFGVVERSGSWDRESLALVPRSTAVVVTNAAHRDVLAGRFPRVRPTVIPVGANVSPDRSRSRQDARAEVGLPADADVVVFFGFVHPVKGLRYLIDAVAELRAAGRDRLHLVIAGGVDSLALPGAQAVAFEAELRDRVAAAGLAGVVRLTGWRPPAQVSALLQAADVAVLPFTRGVTTKSGSVLAALGHGVPTVVTPPEDGPPDPDLLDGVSVLHAVRRDVPSLVTALRRLLDDPALGRRLSTAGLRVAAARSWPSVAAATRAVYADALSCPRRPGPTATGWAGS